MDGSGLLKLIVLGVNMTKYNICDACETVAHCSKHGCIPVQQLAAAEGHHSDKGYSLDTSEAYQAMIAERTQSLRKHLGLDTPLSYEELLHEVWYLRRRVRQLEKQVFELNWQISGESMGR